MVMSIDLNIRERNTEKSMSLSVGRCFGFSVMAPVVGSIIICCNEEVEEETAIPRVDPGAAIYGSLLALGVPSLIVMVCKLELSKCFFTNRSSWEKVHSSADKRVVIGAGGVESGGD